MQDSRLPPPGSRDPANFWMYETGGELKPAIMRFLQDQPLSDEDIRLIRVYLVQWAKSPAWELNPHMDASEAKRLRDLRSLAYKIKTRAEIEAWAAAATAEGMDPF